MPTYKSNPPTEPNLHVLFFQPRLVDLPPQERARA